MGFLSVAITFIGYVLVYAGIANKGRFATAPWTGVVQDAYDDTPSPPSPPTPADPPAQAPRKPRTRQPQFGRRIR